MVDGDVKLTQTLAIIRYLARKTGLDGKTEKEKQLIDLTESEWCDFKEPFVNLSYDPNFKTLKDGYLVNAGKKLARFSTFLGDKPWFAGDKVRIKIR